jgi:hypothetical protein
MNNPRSTNNIDDDVAESRDFITTSLTNMTHRRTVKIRVALSRVDRVAQRRAIKSNAQHDTTTLVTTSIK